MAGNGLGAPAAGIPLVETKALWTWTASGASTVPTAYPTTGGPTKTGLMPQDLQDFVAVPIQIYGNPPTPVSSGTILQWIRNAEDFVEQETNILLTQTWVASPPVVTANMSQNVGIITASGTQVLGVDYDLEDAPYDFYYENSQDNGWMALQLRYRPVKSGVYTGGDTTAIKTYSYIYPLLNQFFRVPRSWFVEDHDFGYIRLVPAVDVTMLPTFAVYLSAMGFSEMLPGAIWLQYTAGLTPADYASRFAFIKQLVLAQAAIQALSTIQSTINYGATSVEMQIDGVSYKTAYSKEGPFNGLIQNFMKQRDDLMKIAKTRVNGPVIGFI